MEVGVAELKEKESRVKVAMVRRYEHVQNIGETNTNRKFSGPHLNDGR